METGKQTTKDEILVISDGKNYYVIPIKHLPQEMVLPTREKDFEKYLSSLKKHPENEKFKIVGVYQTLKEERRKYVAPGISSFSIEKSPTS